ncbi:transposase [Paraburkholderia sediminicola]|uniref:transposase n=1 Tax=Paraburkholderia sediminicola TaxID=458836 RepID=UPI000FF29F3A
MFENLGRETNRLKIVIPLSDSNWEHVKHLFPDPVAKGGRPRRDDRDVLNAILWVLNTGERWHRLPSDFPPQQTCYARYIAWRRVGLIDHVIDLLRAQAFNPPP